ncbi:MAG TPA: YdcF family protein [Staphylococcus sp.]|nr:YdcF family protein [Staphylococcus sp.]
MNILALFCSLLIILIFIGMYLNINFFANIDIFISQVIVGYIVIILRIGSHQLPIDLIIVMLIGCLLVHIKHQHLLQHRMSALFLKRLYHLSFQVFVFTLACAYISLIPVAFNVIFLWISTIMFSALFTFICYISCASCYLNQTHVKKCDTILVLGAGIFNENVTPMLANRLDKALVLYQQFPNAQVIVSGGQGPDEPISEALAMYRYLVAHGVNPKQILIEEKSTSTYENIKFTNLLIQRLFNTTPYIVCVTSQFHIMRALRFGQKLNLKLKGIGSHTPYHFFEVALVRDFLALMYQYKLLLTVYFATLFFMCIFVLWHIPS